MFYLKSGNSVLKSVASNSDIINIILKTAKFINDLQVIKLLEICGGVDLNTVGLP